MYKKIKTHLGYYISLLAILCLGLFLVILVSPNAKQQSMVILMTIFFYVLWGVLHHAINHELTARIVIEYVLIGGIGAVLLFFVIMGGLL
jgi:hypothetical protein